jgi:hypothetical protein
LQWVLEFLPSKVLEESLPPVRQAETLSASLPKDKSQESEPFTGLTEADAARFEAEAALFQVADLLSDNLPERTGQDVLQGMSLNVSQRLIQNGAGKDSPVPLHKKVIQSRSARNQSLASFQGIY